MIIIRYGTYKKKRVATRGSALQFMLPVPASISNMYLIADVFIFYFSRKLIPRRISDSSVILKSSILILIPTIT